MTHALDQSQSSPWALGVPLGLKVHVSAFVERLLVHVRCVMVNVIVSVHVYKCDNVHLVWIYVHVCVAPMGAWSMAGMLWRLLE